MISSGKSLHNPMSMYEDECMASLKEKLIRAEEVKNVYMIIITLCVRVCVCVFMYVRAYVCVCVLVFVHVCMYVFVCTHNL